MSILVYLKILNIWYLACKASSIFSSYQYLTFYNNQCCKTTSNKYVVENGRNVFRASSEIVRNSILNQS